MDVVNFFFGNTLGFEIAHAWWQLIAAGVLSGLSARSQSKEATKQVHQSGEEDRKTLAFKYDMEDYLDQQNKFRRSKGLENYASFGRLSEYAPDFTGSTNLIQPPKKPKPGDY